MPKGLTVVLNQPGKPLELETLPTPDIDPGGILIKNTAAAICGSDLHYWRNDGNYSGPDMRRVPGHEFTGVVHSLGKGVDTDSLRRPLKEGDRVAFPFFNPCNRCYWCVRGEHHACPHRHRRSMQFNLDSYNFDLPPGVTSSTAGRQAEFSQFDLRVTKKVNIGGGRKVEGILQIFNVFNAENPSDFNGNMSAAGFGRPTAYAGDIRHSEQRLAEIGFRVTF